MPPAGVQEKRDRAQRQPGRHRPHRSGGGWPRRGLRRWSSALLKSMMLIRAFEATLAARSDHGFQLFSSGEEAVAVGLCAAMGPDDQLLVQRPLDRSGAGAGAGRRGEVMAELLGKATGPMPGAAAGVGIWPSRQPGSSAPMQVVAGNLTIACRRLGALAAADARGGRDRRLRVRRRRQRRGRPARDHEHRRAVETAAAVRLQQQRLLGLDAGMSQALAPARLA